MSKALVWFRRDLRVADNPALYTACQQHSEVRALYIDCPKQWQHHQQSARQQKFIAQHIVALRARLAKLGIPFEELRADLFDQVPAILARWIKRQQIDALYMNRDIGGINEARRDAAVQKIVAIPCHIYQADCVIDPGTVLTKTGQMYQVFTPFCRAWLVHLQRVGYHVYPAPRRRRQALSVSSPDKLATNTAWPIGEQAAQRRLKRFCQQGLRHYAEQRDIPANTGTSQLSPYLAIGVLSAAQCLAAVEKELGFLPLSRGESGFSWVNELVWREFYRHLLVAYPRLSKQPAV